MIPRAWIMSYEDLLRTFIIGSLISLVFACLNLDSNPYTSHLINTQSRCSSKTGPFCGFLNHRHLMENQLVLPEPVKQMHAALVYNAPISREYAFQIERG